MGGLLYNFGSIMPRARRASIKSAGAACDACRPLADDARANPSGSLFMSALLDEQVGLIEQRIFERRRSKEACLRISEIPVSISLQPPPHSLTSVGGSPETSRLVQIFAVFLQYHIEFDAGLIHHVPQDVGLTSKFQEHSMGMPHRAPPRPDRFHFLSENRRTGRISYAPTRSCHERDLIAAHADRIGQ